MIDRRLGRMNRIRAIIPGVLALLFFFVAGAIGEGLFAEDSQRHRTVELACQEPPHCEETGEVIGYSTPFYKDYFGENEEVWVAVDPKTIQQIKTIGKINKCKTARIYIVCHKTTDQWTNNSQLIDITGRKHKQEPEEITLPPGESQIIFIQAWKKPVICDEGYDVVIDFSPFGKYDLGKDIIDGFEGKGFFVPTKWVCLESITFNHDPDDDIIDGINLRMNALEEVHVPEWKKGEESYPAAYIKNRAIKVKAVFSSAEGVDSATIRAVTKKGGLGNIVKETFSLNKGRMVEQFFYVTGCTSTKVNTFIQEWEWYIETENSPGQVTSSNLITSTNRIFILLAKPQSPWKSKGQAEPWCDVLKETCRWARNAKSPIEAAVKITKYLHTSIGGTYHNSPSYASAQDGGFDFTNFFRNIKTRQAVGDINCFDMGKALVTFANCVGCGLVYRESFLPKDCKLNCIKEIGIGWNCKRELDYHGFGSIGEKIFDACFKLKNSLINDHGIFAVNLNWDEYKKYFVRNCEPIYPKTYLFNIDGSNSDEIGFYLRERIDWAKNKNNFNKCKKGYGLIIPGELLGIKTFYCKKKKINLGEKTRVILKIKNSEDRALNYHWEISGGGIEKDCKENLFYYGSETGNHVVKLTVEKNGNIIDHKCFKVTVLNITEKKYIK